MLLPGGVVPYLGVQYIMSVIRVFLRTEEVINKVLLRAEEVWKSCEVKREGKKNDHHLNI